jgi:hypothetical protein
MIWLAKRAVKWLLLALAIPVSIWAAEAVADQIEARGGSNKVTRVLRGPGRWRRGEPILDD